FSIVINVFRDRRETGAIEASPDVPDPNASEPSAEIESLEFGQLVARHVSSLPLRQREVLVLIAFENLSIGEAATVLGISEQNVRTNLHYARERLRQKLTPFVRIPGRGTP
ncbi:MAG: RNA polymerase sigma factor, partial [Tepidisphaeraceae bacterium]